MNTTKRFRLQSAMEYLMTYGWSILIIAVVLGALYALGVFGGAASLGTACIPVAPFLCSNPSLTTAGLLSFTLGQNSQSTQYNIALACAATSNSLGLPNTGSADPWYYVNTNGVASESTGGSNSPANTLSLVPGQQLAVSGIQCYQSSGATFDPGSVGSAFTGTIWINYTTSSSNVVDGNWLTAKMATITAKTS